MKPPKLRFKPGEFVREKATNQLYCIVWAYRTVQEPHVWLFTLEERNSLDPPDTLLSMYCEGVAGKLTENDRILWEPVRGYLPIHPQDFCHGDREVVTNKRMLNDFERAAG